MTVHRVTFRPDPRVALIPLEQARTLQDRAVTHHKKLRERLARAVRRIRKREAARAEARASRALQEAVTQGIARAQQEYLQKVSERKNEIVQIALAVAEAVIGQAVHDPTTIAARVERELALLSRERWIELRCHPDFLNQTKEVAGHHAVHALIPDTRVPPGGFIVSTNSGEISFDPRSHVAAVRKHLEYDHP